jgi:hypothetical protein
VNCSIFLYQFCEEIVTTNARELYESLRPKRLRITTTYIIKIQQQHNKNPKLEAWFSEGNRSKLQLG